MAKSRVLKEFWQFLMAEKKYWLLPIVIVLVLFPAIALGLPMWIGR